MLKCLNVKCFEINKTMLFKISDNKLLKKYTQIWKKVRNLLNIKFDSEPVFGENDKYKKAKIKVQDGNLNTSFQCQLKMASASVKAEQIDFMTKKQLLAIHFVLT